MATPSRSSRARRAVPGLAPGHEEAGAQPLPAQEDVVRHRQLGDEVQLLVDDGHPGPLRVAHVAEAHLATIHLE